MTMAQAEITNVRLEHSLSGTDLGVHGLRNAVELITDRVTGLVVVTRYFIAFAGLYRRLRRHRRDLVELGRLINDLDVETDEDRARARHSGQRLMNNCRELAEVYELATTLSFWKRGPLHKHLAALCWESVERTEDLAETLALRGSKDFIEYLEERAIEGA